MRKLKTKPLKNKQIYKELDFAVLVSALLAFVAFSKTTLGYTKEQAKQYIENGKRIEFKGEILNDTFYKGIETLTLKTIKLLSKIGEKTQLEPIVKNKKLQEVTRLTIMTHKTRLLLDNVKERTVDKTLSEILNVIACYITIHDCLNVDRNELLKSMDSNTIKYGRQVMTTYKDLIGSILYDICEYKSFHKLELN